MVLQQYLSTLRAQARGRMAREGDDGGEGEPSVAIVNPHSSAQLSSSGELRDRA